MYYNFDDILLIADLNTWKAKTLVVAIVYESDIEIWCASGGSLKSCKLVWGEIGL